MNKQYLQERAEKLARGDIPPPPRKRRRSIAGSAAGGHSASAAGTDTSSRADGGTDTTGVAAEADANVAVRNSHVFFARVSAG